MSSLIAVVPMLLIVLVLGTLSWLMPGLTRRDIFFGVTLPHGMSETPAGKAIITRYRAQVAAVVVISLVALCSLTWLMSRSAWGQTTLPGSIVVVLAVFFLPYFAAHRAARRLSAATPPTEIPGSRIAGTPSAELRRRRYSDYVPWLWELLPLAVILVTAAFLAIGYATVPASIPVHFNAAGAADRFAAKTVVAYFAPLWAQLTQEIVLSGIALLLVGSKALPTASDHRFRRIWLRALYGLKTLGVVMAGLLVAGTTHAAGSSTPSIPWAFPLATGFAVIVLVSLVAISLWTGQGGSRLGDAGDNTTDRLDDRYWKLGIIYVNSNDPSLFVERRFGIGWTLNFGNPVGILLTAGILVLGIVPALVGLLHAHG